MTNMQMPETPVPLVGVSACVKDIDGNNFHAVFRTYVDAVVHGAEAQPLVIPALGGRSSLRTLLNGLDGIMLTGSPSNVEPHHYNGPTSRDGVAHDAHRDATTLPLIRAAIEAGVPLLAICRGFQELNVAYGGTLHQHLEEVPGRLDHRMERHLPLEQRYRPRHSVAITPGAKLHTMLGKQETSVNSLHGQGVDRVGDGLTVEAVASDGTVEAISVDEAHEFALGVQWHAEFAVLDDPDSRAIFSAFRDAIRKRAVNRMRSGRARVV